MLTRFSIYRIIAFSLNAKLSLPTGQLHQVLGKYSPNNFDVKNIDLYNILILRSIDNITSL